MPRPELLLAGSVAWTSSLDGDGAWPPLPDPVAETAPWPNPEGTRRRRPER